MKLRYSLPLLGALALLSGCKKNAAPAGPAALPPPEVGVVTLAAERVEITTELPGRTAALRVAEVRPQVSGIILKRLFTEGTEVKAGEQLYQIDPAPYQAAFDSAQATVARSEAAMKVAKLLAERRQRLAKSNAISKQELDDATAAYEQARADLAASKASLETARINLTYTEVLAPISGRIGRSAITEGALVTSNQTLPLATVHQLDPIYVDVTQSSLQLLRLKREFAAGQLKNTNEQEAATTLVLEDGTEYPETGKLQFSEVSVDPGTGSVTLRAVFPNPRRDLLPGMFVRATLKEGVKEGAILAPQRGVTRNSRGEPTAMVVDAEDKVELRVLKTDRIVGDKWLVTEGLQPGDRLVVEGVQKIRPGAQARAVEFVPPGGSPASATVKTR